MIGDNYKNIVISLSIAVYYLWLNYGVPVIRCIFPMCGDTILMELVGLITPVVTHGQGYRLLTRI